MFSNLIINLLKQIKGKHDLWGLLNIVSNLRACVLRVIKK